MYIYICMYIYIYIDGYFPFVTAKALWGRLWTLNPKPSTQHPYRRGRFEAFKTGDLDPKILETLIKPKLQPLNPKPLNPKP